MGRIQSFAKRYAPSNSLRYQHWELGVDVLLCAGAALLTFAGILSLILLAVLVAAGH